MSYLWIYCAAGPAEISIQQAYTISESCSAVDSRHNKTWFADHYSILWWPWFWFRSRTWQWTMESDYRKNEVWSVLAFSYSYVPLSLACVCVWTLWTELSDACPELQILEEAVPCLRFAADKSYQMLWNMLKHAWGKHFSKQDSCLRVL